jgi:hypothetical protein
MPKPNPPLLYRFVTAPTLALALMIWVGVAPALEGTGLDLSVHDSDLEPTITVREQPGATVQEYQVNHRTYQVKVTPTVGAPYYLVDEDGSGDMAWHRGETHNASNVPQWALLSW